MSAIAPSSSRMSDKQMHPAFCSCHVGSSLTGQEAAERLRHVMRLDPKDTDLSVMAEGPAHLPPPLRRPPHREGVAPVARRGPRGDDPGRHGVRRHYSHGCGGRLPHVMRFNAYQSTAWLPVQCYRHRSRAWLPRLRLGQAGASSVGSRLQLTLHRRRDCMHRKAGHNRRSSVEWSHL